MLKVKDVNPSSFRSIPLHWTLEIETCKKNVKKCKNKSKI